MIYFALIHNAMKYQAGPGRHRRVSASLRTLISRFSKIPCSIDELSSPLSLSYFWRSLLVCVFYGRLALTNCVCLGISGRRFPLIQTGGMRLFGQGVHGFWISGPRAGEAGVLVRLWIGVFSFLVIRLAGDEDESKSKAQNGFFICK